MGARKRAGFLNGRWSVRIPRPAAGAAGRVFEVLFAAGIQGFPAEAAGAVPVEVVGFVSAFATDKHIGALGAANRVGQAGQADAGFGVGVGPG